MSGVPKDNDQLPLENDKAMDQAEEIIDLDDDEIIDLDDDEIKEVVKPQDKANEPMDLDDGIEEIFDTENEPEKNEEPEKNPEPDAIDDELEIEEIEIEKPASDAQKKKTEAEKEMEEAEMQQPQYGAMPGNAKADTKEATQDESGLQYRPTMYKIGYYLGKFILGPSAKLATGTAKLAVRGAKAVGQGALWLGKKAAQGAGTLAVGAYRAAFKYPEGSHMKRVTDEQDERNKARKIEEKNKSKEEKALEKSEKEKAEKLAKKYPGSVVDPKSVEGKILAIREEEAKKAQKEARELEEQARQVRERAEREKAKAMDKADHEKNRGTLRKAFDYATFRQGSKRAGETAESWQNDADALSEKAKNAQTKAQDLKTGIETTKVALRQTLMESLMTPEMPMDQEPEPVMQDPADQQTLDQSMEELLDNQQAIEQSMRENLQEPVDIEQTLKQSMEESNDKAMDQEEEIIDLTDDDEIVDKQTLDQPDKQPVEKAQDEPAKQADADTKKPEEKSAENLEKPAQEKANDDPAVKKEAPVIAQDAPVKEVTPVRIEISFIQLQVESGLLAPEKVGKTAKIKVEKEVYKVKEHQAASSR